MKFLASFLGALVLATTTAAAQPAGRPLLVFVHGRGHLHRDSVAVRVEWERSLRQGARELARGPLFDDRDVRMVWYADVLDPASGEGCRRTSDPVHLTRAPEEEGIAALAGAFLGAVAEAVEEPEGRREAKSLVGDLAFLADPWKRCGVERRLDRVLGEAAAARRPVVLVTHSLGAAVSYRLLRDRPASGATVARWVTIGAPLGDPDLRALLLGDASAGPLRVPASVRSWINVVREGDPWAAPLAPVVGGPRRPTDLVRGRRSGDAHDLAAYLKDEATAEAIVGGWCGAFAAAARPRACMR